MNTNKIPNPDTGKEFYEENPIGRELAEKANKKKIKIRWKVKKRKDKKK